MAVLSLPLSGRPDLAWGCRNIYRTIRMSQCIFAARHATASIPQACFDCGTGYRGASCSQVILRQGTGNHVSVMK
jgi:hypothetical protein